MSKCPLVRKALSASLVYRHSAAHAPFGCEVTVGQFDRLATDIPNFFLHEPLGQSAAPTGLRDVIAIAAGASHSLALKSHGTVVGWGDNYFGQSTVPPGLTGVTAIAAGGYHSLALKSDGIVVGWGDKDRKSGG